MRLISGTWTKKTFAELDPDPAWQEWNARRSEASAPKGESMVQVQQRIVGALDRLTGEHEGEHVAIISHGDVIKSALMHDLGAPLDRIHQLEVSPASVSIVTAEGGYGKVMLMNETGELISRGKGKRQTSRGKMSGSAATGGKAGQPARCARRKASRFPDRRSPRLSPRQWPS